MPVDNAANGKPPHIDDYKIPNIKGFNPSKVEHKLEKDLEKELKSDLKKFPQPKVNAFLC